jgi:hypothetical protein
VCPIKESKRFGNLMDHLRSEDEVGFGQRRGQQPL